MIKIIDGYGFEQDDMQFILYAYGERQKQAAFGRTVADGEMVEYKEVLGYFSSMQAMCDACLKHATRARAEAEQIDSLRGYISAMNKIAADIRNAIGTHTFQ